MSFLNGTGLANDKTADYPAKVRLSVFVPETDCALGLAVFIGNLKLREHMSFLNDTDLAKGKAVDFPVR